MMPIKSLTVVIALGFTVLSVTPSQAIEPAVKCESGKLKISSKYSACRLKADAKGVKKGEDPDYTKCEDKFSDKWGKTEEKAGAGNCPSEGDKESMGARITANSDEIVTLLSGVRYEDTGLGTVIDHQTGLEWQKTDDAGGVTDKDNLYNWCADAAPTDASCDDPARPPDGTAFTDFLAGLNAPDGSGATSSSGPTDTGCYAGRCDWRIPVIEELTTIIDCSFGDPCIDQSAFGPTNAADGYWSSSSEDGGFGFAWGVDFGTGLAGVGHKPGVDGHVRAVRGGP